jgi:hypothetical protein
MYRFICCDALPAITRMPQRKQTTSRKRKQPKPPPFAPQKTAFSACHVSWDVILSNQGTAETLGSWRWLWTLAQVFGTLPHADEMMRWMCFRDSRPVIWKKKANELFALTPMDLMHVKIETIYNAWGYEVHLMYRPGVLQLALAKHGGSFAAINAAFLARKSRNAKRKKPHRRCDSRRVIYSDEDEY